ncbi:unnamed protein product [marine sediment metagenome]|uniref:Uncharacterized protein n=1 Tax=marine sediment metagenome TaxID=412755 RepID=X1HNV2_9ZZZZ
MIILLLLFDISVHLFWQAHLSSYKFYADSRNPYVYAHPTTEVFEIVKRVEQYAEVHEDGHNMPIQVICPGDDYWPLPWYFRSFTNVGWWNKVDNEAPLAPVIIASPAVEADLARKLWELTPVEERQMYFPFFDDPYYVWLRPEVELLGFVRKDLWEACQRKSVPDPNELIRKASEK